ncbi:unnamed protein product [Blepharisma stoltei]|uniref:FHA domain-containing protein n=1 Tax=Blepharisma stoltei TaxID=1481888 RepID=A0AAU9IY02_9CILI|nr:unnamed protein product [Blepharisma stoltei]
MFSFKRLCACCFVPKPDDIHLDTIEKDHNDPNSNSNQQESALQLVTDSKSQLNQTITEITKLTLSIIDTEGMQIGTEYEIYPMGLKGSSRRIQDGCVYAGTLRFENNIIINDIILSENEKGVGKKHFLIQFDKYQKNYFLKDLGDGMGTFIRLDKPLKLKSNHIISFGDSHLVITIEQPNLCLKFIDGPKTEEKFTYGPADGPIKIGRMADCNIRFDDSSLSRYQCIFKFEDSWYLIDGDGRKLSTNGTWLFCEDFFEIFDGLVFKAGQTLFKAQYNAEMINLNND